MPAAHRLVRLLLLIPILATAGAPATSPTPSPTPAWPLPPLDYFINKMPPPPREGSWRDRMDLSDVVAHQHMITEADRESIARTYRFNIFTFSDVLGPPFTAKNYPRTGIFFSKVIASANVIVAGLKGHYRRLRPFQGHPDQVQLLVRNEPGYGYPSGHTTRSRLCALILAEIDPASRALFVPVAERVGLDRIMAGEHYQTDLAAGRQLAKILFRILNKNPQFLDELAAVKAAEWTPPPKSPSVH